MGNLHEISLAEACARFRQRVATYLAEKQERVSQGRSAPWITSPAGTASNISTRSPGWSTRPEHHWARRGADTSPNREETIADVGSAGSSTSCRWWIRRLRTGIRCSSILESKTFYSLNPTGTGSGRGSNRPPLQEISHRLQAVFEVEGARADAVCWPSSRLRQHQLVQLRED